MHKGVVERAKSVGLDYYFDKAIVSNSLTAHRIIQLAKLKNLGDQMEEVFFRAYFTEGRDLNDTSTLIELGCLPGLDENEVREVVENEDVYLNNVQKEIIEAQEIGVPGVPFFVFDRKYAISGAQSHEVFVKTINEANK